jgi:uncharacterized protein
MTLGLQLGRPGIYQMPVREPAELTAVRLDVAGFVGVALRGPVDVPTPVISWADYERRFGGLDRNVSGRDRMLPYAVQAFFAQGGQRAWVVRVGPVGSDLPTEEAATARFKIGRPGAQSWELTAADEGAWGSALAITLRFSVAVSVTAKVVAPNRLQVLAGGQIQDHSLLRIRYGDLRIGVFRWARILTDPADRRRLIALDEALPQTGDQPTSDNAAVEVITGTLMINDPSGPGRSERIAGLGLREGHSRFPRSVLSQESLLIRTVGDWDMSLQPSPQLDDWTATRVHPGVDRSDRVDRASFFDVGDADADPLDENPHRGVDLMGRQGEVGILCVPDLTWRSQPIPVPAPARPAKPIRWQRDCCCSPVRRESEPTPVPTELPSMLDGRDDAELREIIERQQRVLQVAALRRRFIALLDVPTGLPADRMTDWRAEFDSSFAAAYHPWLGVSPTDRGALGTVGPGTAVLVPPSAFAAGIIADRERRLGLSFGPANQLALGAVRAADPVSDALADQLHLLSINVFGAERDGFRLGAARTLSSDRDYRQLSVRRLMTMLALTLQRYGENVLVFEPNTSELRSRLTNTITELLRDLHRRGAFSGATEEESFFVRCDDATNPPQSQALGRLLAEVGVAPAEPLEYLVLRIASDGEGGLLVEERARTALAANPRDLEVAGV